MHMRADQSAWSLVSRALATAALLAAPVVGGTWRTVSLPKTVCSGLCSSGKEWYSGNYAKAYKKTCIKYVGCANRFVGYKCECNACKTACSAGQKASACTQRGSCKSLSSRLCTKYAKGADRVCSACGTNTYQTSRSHTSTSCTSQPTCGKGQRISADSKTARRTCSSCGSNTYQTSSSHRSTSCTGQPTCGTGTKYAASSVSAQRTCPACAANQYQTSSSHRASSCSAQSTCGRGQRISADSKTAKRTCSNCGANTYQTAASHRNTSCLSQSTACGKGQRISADSKTAKRTCSACPANTYQTSSSHRSTSCSAQPSCGQGQLMSGDTKSARRACSDCGANTYQDATSHRGTACPSQPVCGKGQRISADSKTAKRSCSACPANTFKKSSSHRGTACKRQGICVAGERVRGNVSKTADVECEACPPGMFQAAKRHRNASCVQQQQQQQRSNQPSAASKAAGSSDDAGLPLTHIAAVSLGLVALVALAITVACCTGVLHVGNSDKGFWDRGMQEYMELERLSSAAGHDEEDALDSVGLDSRIEARLRSMCSPEAAEQKLRGMVFNSNCRELEVDATRKLGNGSFGVVYAGTWRKRPVAVKKLHLATQEVAEFRAIKKELLQETEFHSALDHDNVVRLVGFTTKPHMCIVLEFMENGSVFDLMNDKESPLVFKEEPTGALATAALDIAKGMEYLHGLPTPILHRDLKCLNVLVSEDWTYKIADFGISRVKAMDHGGDTQVMTQCGTPKWTAPEVFRGGNYNEAVDVYAYAMTLFEMVTGEIPFSEFSQVEVGFMVSTQHKRPQGMPMHDAELLPITVLAKECWAEAAEERPSFMDIVKNLRQQFGDDRHFPRRYIATAATNACIIVDEDISDATHSPPPSVHIDV